MESGWADWKEGEKSKKERLASYVKKYFLKKKNFKKAAQRKKYRLAWLN